MPRNIQIKAEIGEGYLIPEREMLAGLFGPIMPTYAVIKKAREANKLGEYIQFGKSYYYRRQDNEMRFKELNRRTLLEQAEPKPLNRYNRRGRPRKSGER